MTDGSSSTLLQRKQTANFRWLWTGFSVSQVGSQISEIAIPLAAILVADAGAAELGLLSAVQRLPVLLFGMLAGVFVDRMRRRRLLIASDLFRAAVVALIPLSALLADVRIELLFIVSFAVGSATVLADVSHQSLLPSIVDRRSLLDKNSKLAISQSAADVSGPTVGGALVQITSASAAIAVDALTYLVSAFCTSRIDVEEATPDGKQPPNAAGIRAEMREGLSLVLRHPLLRPLSLASAIYNGFFVMFLTLYLLFVFSDLGVSAVALGVSFGFYGFGAIASSSMAERLLSSGRPGARVVLAAVLAGLGPLLIPLVRTSGLAAAILVSLALLLAGAGTQLFNVATITVRQAITPDELLGRVSATTRFLAGAAAPAGALAAGLAGELLPLRTALALAAAGLLVPALLVLASPVRRLAKRDLALDPQE